jgi:fumarylacetoacetate (FAA) hydrolase
MKLVTFRPGARERAGILVHEGGTPRVIDLARGFAWLERRAKRPDDPARLIKRYGRGVLGFIKRIERTRPAADELVRVWASGDLPQVHNGDALSYALSEVSLSAPLPRPPSLRDGYAFRQHVESARKIRGLDMIPEFDRFPVFYFGNHKSIVGPGDVTVQTAHLDRLDYELEAAVVLGKGGKNLTASNADEGIFGMCIMNDWSARGLQAQEMKLNLGPAKGKDFATSLGPWLVTLDELLPRATRDRERGLVFDMNMQASVNGERLSQGNLKEMAFTFAQIVERASYGVDLSPGDVIGSGTCGSGCLLELNGSGRMDNRWLRPDDEVVLEIEGLGRLENRVVLAESIERAPHVG